MWGACHLDLTGAYHQPMDEDDDGCGTLVKDQRF